MKMVDRVPRNPSQPDRPPSSREAPPPRAPLDDAPALQQAAADFAALLGDNSQTERQEVRRDRKTHERADDSAEDHDATSPSTTKSGGREQRVHRKSDDASNSGQDGESLAEDTVPVEETPLVAMGDAILQSFAKADVAPIADVAPAEPSQSFETVAQQIADRILVADPASGNREVRITLKDSILPGTEIRIEQQSGKLQIQFFTDSPRSHELLAQHQASLQERLAEKLARHDVVVNVEFDARGQDQPQDGRSRQRRDLQEETEETS